jgi:hypothetical protein
MLAEPNFTYVLYLSTDDNELEQVIFLGASEDSCKLYMNGLNPNNIGIDNRPNLFKWLSLVEANLDAQERNDLEYAFMHNPETKFSYSVKDMTLYIKQINKY